ncbi:MAG: hypothetical protein HFI70_11835 [Lachnospiraceae bacterium]|nr:hypothetical protein [Lachnospiraceae bacterium]
MSAHDFDKETEKEQTLFYSLCCREDRQKLTREIPMTFNDFLRISCILFHMDFTFYETHLNELFPEFYQQKEHMLTRHHDILLEYPDYYEDECFEEKIRIWLTEFCDQITDKSMQTDCRKRLKIDFKHNGKPFIL